MLWDRLMNPFLISPFTLLQGRDCGWSWPFVTPTYQPPQHGCCKKEIWQNLGLLGTQILSDNDAFRLQSVHWADNPLIKQIPERTNSAVRRSERWEDHPKLKVMRMTFGKALLQSTSRTLVPLVQSRRADGHTNPENNSSMTLSWLFQFSEVVSTNTKAECTGMTMHHQNYQHIQVHVWSPSQ